MDVSKDGFVRSWIVSGTHKEALEAAIEYCKCEESNPNQEEVGGFILYQQALDGEHSFEFVAVTNANKGTPTAFGLYTADKAEFGKLVVSKLITGAHIYASFHYHPGGYGANPSSIDLYQLFQTFKRNYIYSADGTLKRFDSLSTDQEEVLRVVSFFKDGYLATKVEDNITIWKSLNVILNESESQEQAE